jgi:hypothetical protein
MSPPHGSLNSAAISDSIKVKLINLLKVSLLAPYYNYLFWNNGRPNLKVSHLPSTSLSSSSSTHLSQPDLSSSSFNPTHQCRHCSSGWSFSLPHSEGWSLL